MTSVVKAINEIPAVRWLGVIVAIIASAIGMTWTLSAKFNDMQRDITEMKADVSGFSDEMKDHDRRIRANEEYRIAAQAREQVLREMKAQAEP